MQSAVAQAIVPDLTVPAPAAASGAASVVPTAGVTPPPAPVPTPTATPAAGGAVSQALGAYKAATDAGRASVAADPLAGQVLSEKAKTDAAQAEAAASLQANMAKSNAITNLPDPERPSVPRLKPLTPVTEDPAYQDALHKDPMRVMGQFLPLLAAFGALTTQQPATAALNAATAAIGAAKNKDDKELARAHATWMENMKAAVDNNANLVSEYTLALNDRNGTMADRMAKVQAIASQNKDILVLAGLRSGNIEGITNLLALQQHAGDGVAGMIQHTEEVNAQNATRADASLRAWAELEVKKGQISPNDLVGQILLKASQVGWDKVTPEEKDALQRAQDYQNSIHPPAGGDLAALLQANGGAVSVGAPGAPRPAPAAAPAGAPIATAPAAAAAPAPVTTAPPKAAAATTAPPVSMLKEGMITPMFDSAGKSRGSWTLRGGKAVQVGG